MSIRHFIWTILGYPSEPPHDYAPSTTFFPELDVERMKRRLQLEEEGTRHGERNDPDTNSHSLDDIEQRIITAIETEKQLAYETFVNHLETYGDRISSLGFQTRFAQAVAAADSAISDFKAQVHIGTDLLFQLRRDVVLIEEEIKRFQHKHGLQRMARYPRSWTLRGGVILVLLVAEGVLNGTFLALGHILGLVGGIGEALVIAVLNIGVGLGVGWKVAPFVVHRRLFWKLVGILGCLLYVAWTFGFNLLVAHYRHTLGLVGLGVAQPEQAGRIAFESWLAHPFGVTDIQAWLLFALGCAFSLIAATDGWTMDDPYPGYGALARHQTKLIDEYIDQKKSLMDELQKVRDAALEKMESTARDIERRQAEYHTILGNRGRLKELFQQHLDHLELCANDLLAAYREANRRARNTPLPGHFSRLWEMPRPADPGFGQGDHELETEIGHFFAQLEEKRQKVNAEYDAAVLTYERIAQLTPEDLRDGRFRPPQA